MDERVLVELGATVRSHPWWQARARLTGALLKERGVRPPARVLDVGCGWGVTLEFLERQGYRVSGLDVSRAALESLDRAGRELIEADITATAPAQPRFDTVLALDVIEHIDDDRAAVARLGALAKPGGLLLVSVPALPDLFSEFDRIQGHRRRYLPERLRDTFREADVELESLLWWGAWMVPVLRWQRGRQIASAEMSATEVYSRYLRLPPWPGEWALRAAYAIEQPFALGAKLRTGTSLFAVARKR
jgi:SAM-dependent methyltransferase